MYTPLTVSEICNAMAAYQSSLISLKSLRAFLALCEMRAIRRAALNSRRNKSGFRVLYQKNEITALTGLSGRSSAKAITELERAGLVFFSPEEIRLNRQIPGFAQDLTEELRGGRSERRPVPVPRALLKHLAKASSGALILTALAYCIRGLTLSRVGEIKTSGRAKINWIASVFGLSERAVQYARAALIKDGVISEDATEKQWVLNRHGAYFAVLLTFGRTKSANMEPKRSHIGSTKKHKIAPQGVKTCAKIAAPYRDKKSYFVNRNQKTLSTAQKPAGVSTKQGRGGKPTIRDVKREDLFSFSNMEILYTQAVKAGIAEPSEAGALNFLAAACRARHVEGDAPRVFMGIIRKKLFKHITQADEDRALAALRLYRSDDPTRFRYESEYVWSKAA